MDELRLGVIDSLPAQRTLPTSVPLFQHRRLVVPLSPMLGCCVGRFVTKTQLYDNMSSSSSL